MSLPKCVSRSGGNDQFAVFSNDLGTVMQRLLSGRDVVASTPFATYAVDVREDADHLYLDAELPGFSKDEIDITLEKQVLSINAQHKEVAGGIAGQTAGEDENKGEYLLRERRQVRYSRSFSLPPSVDDALVDAKLADGVLSVKLNKRQESKPRKIAVN